MGEAWTKAGGAGVGGKQENGGGISGTRAGLCRADC